MIELYAPPEYWRLTPEQKAGICNGCGSRSTAWVPDTIWGLSIKAACNIHDYMYHAGATQEDKDEADIVFLNNMLRIIQAETLWPVLARLRAHRARIYYRAVRDFGGPFFWAGKNEPSEMGMAVYA